MYDHDASLNTSPFIRHILQSGTQECTFLTHMGVFKPDTLYMHTVLMNHVPSLRALPESEHMTSYVESFSPSNLAHASVHECAIIAIYYKQNIICFGPLNCFILFFIVFIYSNNHVTIKNKVIMWLCIISYYIIIIKGAGDTKVHRHRLERVLNTLSK